MFSANKEFGAFIYKKRKERKLSLRQAAERIGISHSYLDKIEKIGLDKVGDGLRPSIDVMKGISAAYNLSFDYLMEVCGYMEPDGSSLVRISNPDILAISRAESKFSTQQAEMIRKYAQYMFPEAFEDDGRDD